MAAKPSGWELMEKALGESFKEFSKKELSELNKKLDKIDSWVQKNLKNEIQTVTIDEKKAVGKVEGLLHERLPHLIKLLSLNFHVLLVGSTGSGKTTGAMQAAEALGLESHSISVGQQTSKSDIMGFINANGDYVTTSFREAYENGALFIMDEIDAGNSNVLIVINSALSNGVCNFPDKKVLMHKNFKFVATANTFGRGRDLNYVGRNLLDLATLDRFITVQWEYSNAVEAGVRKDVKYKVDQIREYIASNKIDGFVSTRTAFAISALVDSDMDMKAAFSICLYNKFPEKEYHNILRNLF